jgi:hypothetical protein
MAPVLSSLFLARQPHMQIYFCNTQIKQLQHTSETNEAFGTYTYNICNI